jgi:hypothetical protein
MSSRHKKFTNAYYWLLSQLPYVVFIILILVTSCARTPDPPAQTYPYKPFLALHVCLDNTLSYPLQFQQEAAKNIAAAIDSYIAPNMQGMFVDVSKIEANSIQDTFVTFSTPAIPTIAKPQAGNDPYQYAKALSEWKKAVPKINGLVASVRASIKPSLDKLRSIHWQEVGGTDIPGCADTAAEEFSHFASGNKVLLYVSDMQNNSDVNFSRNINLLGAKVIVAFMPCQVESACEQLKAFYTHQFKAWNASTIEYYSPAESSAEHITGF